MNNKNTATLTLTDETNNRTVLPNYGKTTYFKSQTPRIIVISRHYAWRVVRKTLFKETRDKKIKTHVFATISDAYQSNLIES